MHTISVLVSIVVAVNLTKQNMEKLKLWQKDVLY
ncbi:hypothetical protein EV143_101489 [Flavobacterium chryseum]|nr:hypothetical protein EV143_101489 [Flavobacterium sp. P3160]